jgi:hypothetical protein
VKTYTAQTNGSFLTATTVVALMALSPVLVLAQQTPQKAPKDSTNRKSLISQAAEKADSGLAKGGRAASATVKAVADTVDSGIVRVGRRGQALKDTVSNRVTEEYKFAKRNVGQAVDIATDKVTGTVDGVVSTVDSTVTSANRSVVEEFEAMDRELTTPQKIQASVQSVVAAGSAYRAYSLLARFANVSAGARELMILKADEAMHIAAIKRGEAIGGDVAAFLENPQGARNAYIETLTAQRVQAFQELDVVSNETWIQKQGRKIRGGRSLVQITDEIAKLDAELQFMNNTSGANASTQDIFKAAQEAPAKLAEVRKKINALAKSKYGKYLTESRNGKITPSGTEMVVKVKNRFGLGVRQSLRIVGSLGTILVAIDQGTAAYLIWSRENPEAPLSPIAIPVAKASVNAILEQVKNLRTQP